MTIVDAISRFIYRPEPATSAATALFDDGLVEIARLIAVNDPVRAAPLPDAWMSRPDRRARR